MIVHQLKKIILILLLTMTKANASTDNLKHLQIELKDGLVIIEMYPEKAPKHVARIKELVQEKFYDNIVFHRVIDGFMTQTGDPTGTGMGGSKKPNLPAEFNDIHHDRGVASMARSMDPNSANSQFFIMLAPSSHLDGEYTAWGKVISGMDYVDNIKKGSPNDNGTVENPDKMISVKLIAHGDAK